MRCRPFRDRYGDLRAGAECPVILAAFLEGDVQSNEQWCLILLENTQRVAKRESQAWECEGNAFSLKVKAELSYLVQLFGNETLALNTDDLLAALRDWQAAITCKGLLQDAGVVERQTHQT